MSSALHTSRVSHQRLAPELCQVEPKASLGWRFWLPVVGVAIAVLTSYHHLWFAMEAGGEKLNDADLADTIGATSVLKQIGTLFYASVGFLLLMARPQRSVTVFMPLMAAVGLLALYTLASSAWSELPTTTVRRAATPLFIFVSAFGIMRHWKPLDICRAVSIVSTLFLVIGVLAELRYGTFLRGHEYRFSGTLHPNRQALNCALLALASLALYAANGRKTSLIFLCVAFAFLLLTKSRGGFMACMAAIALLWWLGASNIKRSGVLLCGGALLSVLLMYLAFTPGVGPDWQEIGSMGRQAPTADPTTLTGRIPIWQQVYTDASERPWLGFGYGAFWTPHRVHSYSFIHDGWAFSNAHSIYLEAMANIGLVGVAFALAVLSIATWRSLTLLKHRSDPALHFVLAFFALCAVSGVVEAICVSPGYEFTVASLGIMAITMYPSPEAGDDG